MWAYWYMSLWDTHVSMHTKDMPMLRIKFMENDEQSYCRHRRAIQLLDSFVLDAAYMRYSSQEIIGSAILIVLYHEYQKIQWASQRQWKQITIKSKKAKSAIDAYMGQCGMKMEQLHACSKYMWPLICIEMDYRPPQVQNITRYEELISYQTYNRFEIEYEKRRLYGAQ